MKTIAAWFTLFLTVLFLSACGGGGGGDSTGNYDPIATDPIATDPIATDPIATDPIDTTSPVLQSITLPNPSEYYSLACNSTGHYPNLIQVIPVNINDDNMIDFIVPYNCAPPPELWGTHLDTSKPDFLIAYVSQPDGSYKIANEEVFGTRHMSLGGEGKYARGDINGDGRDDFAWSLSWEDGRSGEDWMSNATKPSVLMSTADGGYEVVRLGRRNWGHSVGLVNNADGTVEVFFGGFVTGLQAFRYENGEFVDVTHTYPADAGEWAYGANTIDDVNGVTEYIVASSVVATMVDSIYTVTERGAKLFKRIGGVWTELDRFHFTADFTVRYLTWNETVDSGNYSTNPVFTINGEQYVIWGFDDFHVMKGGLTGEGNDLIVGKLAGEKPRNFEYVEGGYYRQGENTDAANLFQFFEFSDTGLTLIENPLIDEDITNNNGFFFDVKDINNDGYSDVIAYTFTKPWNNERVEEGGKPIVYLSDGFGNLVQKDISHLPALSDIESSSIMYDVNSDGIMDLILFNGPDYDGTGEIIEIHLLRSPLTL